MSLLLVFIDDDDDNTYVADVVNDVVAVSMNSFKD